MWSYNPLSGYASGHYVHNDYTGDDGLFNVGGLDPNLVHLVRFGDDASGYSRSYVTEWYDDAPDRASAQPLSIAQSETRMLEASLALRNDVGHIRGTVVDRETGEPVEDVQVTYISGTEGTSSYSSGYLGWTDRLGRYRWGGLDPGATYKIRFSDSSSGYVDQYFDDKPDATSADMVTLIAGDWFTADARLDLNPNMAVIEGVVSAEDTQLPMTRGQVSLRSWNDMSGYWDWEGWSSIGKDGSYRIRGDQARRGVCRLRMGPAQLRDLVVSRRVLRQSTRRRLGRPRLLSAGERRTIDFALVPYMWIRGTVTREGTTEPIGGIKVNVYAPSTASGYEFVNSDTTDADGEYALWDLNETKQYKLEFIDESGAWRTEYYNDKPTLDEGDFLPLVPMENVFDAQLTDATKPTASASADACRQRDGWRKAPATVTLVGNDGGSGLAGIAYRIGAGSDTSYTVPFAVPEGIVDVSYWAVDNADNRSVPQMLTVKSDGTAPSVPAGLTYSALTTSTVTLTWSASSDGAGSGVGGYEVYKDGTLVQTVTTGTSLKLTGLTPGAAIEFQVLAIDNVGNESALSAVKTITMPDVDGSAQVPGTGRAASRHRRRRLRRPRRS